MRLLSACLAATVIIVALAFVRTTARASGHAANDESAVREVVQKYMDARERQDAPTLEALFTEDADQLVSSGEWRKGRKELVQGTLASSQTMPGKRTITVESLRFLGADVALADGHYEISGLPNNQTRKMWTTLILRRSANTWHIAAIRNMLPAPQAPPK